MGRFHAVMWQDGDFGRTASVLSFNSKTARSAYALQCSMRFEDLCYDRKDMLLRHGLAHWLVLCDNLESTFFFISQ